MPRKVSARLWSRLASVKVLFNAHPAWGVVVVWVPDPKLAGCYLLGRIPED